MLEKRWWISTWARTRTRLHPLIFSTFTTSLRFGVSTLRGFTGIKRRSIRLETSLPCSPALGREQYLEVFFALVTNLKKTSCLKYSMLINSSHEEFMYVSWFFYCVWGVFVPLENFSLISRRHHCRWRVANFDLCSVLMAIKKWGFFNLPHLLWHGASFYNGHLRGPVILTPNAERLEVLPVFTIYVCRGWDSNTRPSALAPCATAAGAR